VAIGRAISSETRSKTTTRRELAVAELAARQHGVVTRDQLVAIGFGSRAIDDRIARGLLHPIHRGVFAVAHRLRTRETTWMAAVLAAGPAAVLSHRSAAALWGIRPSSRAVSDVIAPRKCRRAGIHAHRTVLPPDEVTVHHGIPVTNPARTLFDLAAVVSPQQLSHVLNEAEIRRLASPVSLDALIARHPRRNGTQALRRASTASDRPARPSSEATSRPRSSTSWTTTACRARG
jgi:predicted transcriptional regulator of viral defense system